MTVYPATARTTSVLTRRGAQAEQTRQLVLDTAHRLFTQHGYDATSLQMIADEMGVAKAAVYYYFKTKVEILYAISQVLFAQMSELIDLAAAQTTRVARVRTMVEGYVTMLVDTRHDVAMKSSDPAFHRELKSTAAIRELERRGLQVLFGDTPTAEDRAAYLLVLAVPETIAALDDLTDDELRQVLVRNCLRLLRVRT
jgi:AcrR family transcriptional regulator